MGDVRTALEVTLASDARLKAGRYAALVSLCRVLADQIDWADEAVSSRLTAAYLSALKDIDRALGGTAAGGAKESDRAGTLAKLQGIKGGRSA